LQIFLLASAFIKSQQIVVPLAVSVGADIRTVRALNHGDVCSFPINERIKGIRTSIYGFDDLLTSPAPSTAALSSEMCYAFVRVVSWLLVDTSDLNVCHLDLRPLKLIAQVCFA
jgi:hypothetical protein